MTYLMEFAEERKAIRPTDNTWLQMPSKFGPIDVLIIRAKLKESVRTLVAVPATKNNITVLLAEKSSNSQFHESDWIVPPFLIFGNSFAAGGPFVRKGRADPLPDGFDKILFFHGGVFRPDLPFFVPNSLSESIEIGSSIDNIDFSKWDLMVWVHGAVVRPPSSTEMDWFPVPWTVHSLGHLDLWLEQFRCWHQGLPIPSDISYPS